MAMGSSLSCDVPSPCPALVEAASQDAQPIRSESSSILGVKCLMDIRELEFGQLVQHRKILLREQAESLDVSRTIDGALVDEHQGR